MAHRLLISAPGDIPTSDIETVMTVVARWNVMYGEQFGAVIVPMHWSTHSAAEHGVRPQAALNDQLVDAADVVLALFWHRLGSPTGSADSGTLEEIDRAHSRGAYVGVLRCGRDVPQKDLDVAQVQRLDDYMSGARSRSLILEYGDPNVLAQHVEAVLNRAVSQVQTRAAAIAAAPAGAEIWPRVDASERVKTDSKGRVKTDTRWRLVLANTGSEVARHVRHRLEPESHEDQLPLQMDDERELEALAPGGEASYSLALHMGVAPQVRCVVDWEDSTGEHTNAATLRFF